MEFFGYKKCSTCRNAHKFLGELGVDVPFQDFVEKPPTKAQLQSWIDRLGQGVAPFVNVKGTRYKELGLRDRNMTDAQWIALLTEDGKLLKRPVLVTDHHVVVGFDKNAYQEVADGG